MKADNPVTTPLLSHTCPKCFNSIPSYIGSSAYYTICSYCNADYTSYAGVLTKTPSFTGKKPAKLDLPIGSIGTIKNITYVVIAYALKKEKGTKYTWAEYSLFNPLNGYATLSNYDGHWTYYSSLNELPKKQEFNVRIYQSKSYRMFSRYTAEIEAACGEFPYNIKATDNTYVEEFIHPPFVLSYEKTEDEMAWLLGEYIPAEDMKSGFNLNTVPIGIGMAQPYKTSFSYQGLLNLLKITLLVFCCLQIFFYYGAKEELVYSQSFVIDDSNARKEIYTPAFDLKYGTKNVEIILTAEMSNSWMYGDFTLVNEKTGESFHTEIEASYYHGYEDGSSWTEDNSWKSQVISSVPEGRYYLIIYPDKPMFFNTPTRVSVTRDVPIYSNMILSWLILAIFPIFYFYRSSKFEVERWENSDFDYYTA